MVRRVRLLGRLHCPFHYPFLPVCDARAYVCMGVRGLYGCWCVKAPSCACVTAPPGVLVPSLPPLVPTCPPETLSLLSRRADLLASLSGRLAAWRELSQPASLALPLRQLSLPLAAFGGEWSGRREVERERQAAPGALSPSRPSRPLSQRAHPSLFSIPPSFPVSQRAHTH